MASVTGIFRDFTPDKVGVLLPLTKVTWVDGQEAAIGVQGIIHAAPAVISAQIPAVAGANGGKSMRTAASDITNYRSMGPLVALGIYRERSAAALDNERIQIDDPYATAAGDMDGIQINPISDFTWFVSAKRTGGMSEQATIEIEFYHRTTGGTETLIVTVATTNLTASFVTYTGVENISQSFSTNERLVAYFFIVNDGIPP